MGLPGKGRERVATVLDSEESQQQHDETNRPSRQKVVAQRVFLLCPSAENAQNQQDANVESAPQNQVVGKFSQNRRPSRSALYPRR